MSAWRAAADAGDFPAALAAWKAAFAGREQADEATWELAEIEERWGDRHWFAGESGSGSHYLAARTALMPQGARFPPAEAERRQQVFTRIVDKHLYGIGPDGRPRNGFKGRRHPADGGALMGAARPPVPAQPAPSVPPAAPPPTVVAPTPVAQEVRPSAPSKEVVAAEPSPAATPQRQGRRTPRDPIAQAALAAGHWEQVAMGDLWLAVGGALRSVDASAARLALEHARDCFVSYNIAWQAGMPASRWDPDYADTIESLTRDIDQLPSERVVPDWGLLVLELRFREALADPPPGDTPVRKALRAVLAEACRLSGLDPGPGLCAGDRA